jgi:hypothetical protein
MIEHLLCTHCTFGTSALEEASGSPWTKSFVVRVTA